LRNSEIEVHPASSVDDAFRLFARRSYDLGLLAAEDSEEATMLSNELKKSKARQRVALLVGAPEYIREMGVGVPCARPQIGGSLRHWQPAGDTRAVSGR